MRVHVQKAFGALMTETYRSLSLRNRFYSFGVIGVLLATTQLYGQDKPPVYPRVAGYVGLLHPLLTYSQQEMSSNFNGYYVVGLPTGINLWKSDRIGFSVEFVPQVRVENGVSRMGNFLFHPGLLVNLGHGYTFAGRAAFETSGRYGFTPVLNKVVKRGHSSTLFVAVPLPVRFGLDRPVSLTAGFQFGIGF